MTAPVNRPRNTSVARDPKWWTGQEPPETYVIVVSRGEPRRSNGQMQQAAYGQVQRYLQKAGIEVNEVTLALAVQLIVKDHIEPEGAQGVMLQRMSVLAYLDTARKALGDLERHDA